MQNHLHTTTSITTVNIQATGPALSTHGDQITATSLQVAEHFGKRHADVIRAIRNLGCSEEFGLRNFALVITEFVNGKGGVQKAPAYQITRDGFAMLAMGFTGKEAVRWKEAYISTFNAMEAKLRALYVEPLLSDKEFRRSITLRQRLTLQEQSRKLQALIEAETVPAARRNLYWQLRQVNDALGVPTESAVQLLGADAPPLPILEGPAGTA